jgi:hypothetical protein
MACCGVFSYRHELLFGDKARGSVAGHEIKILPSVRDSQYISPKIGMKRQSFTNFPSQRFNTLLTCYSLMFKSIGQTLSGHKQIVIAAIAVSGMLLYAFPAQQLAVAQTLDNDQNLAQRIVQDTEQRIDQDQDQDQTQDIDQDLTQSNEANIDQSEENNQANIIETGDNTASTTQTADENVVSARGGDADSWSKAHKGDSSASSEGGDAEAAVENEAVTIQDSSADNNVLVNENTFGDDVALVDQDNTADQTAVNVGVQEQDQDATNLDFDFATQYGFQCRADLSIQSAAFC